MKLIKFELVPCTPCKMLGDFLNEVGVKPDQTINLYKATPEERALADKHEIMQPPVLLLLDDEGNEIDKVVGQGRSKVLGILTKRGLI
ncbi:thioredoxin domain-containing protein [Bacillus wiedmannii]|uniref:thioredoxin domain-containing protein n=1 Tax=Bacillus wiedmannii TaxID=1890302 RepID=UPI000BF07D3E|nr:thioredoxin domain-containing protein [Bacillus wiedmannii]PEN61663.1 hypothetical protein CN576_21780 [Bacillus wiedmannii]PHA62907.1 hypothetical protein COE75_16880 [Bacillus wiedmannii]